MPKYNKFELYEASVQTPERHTQWFVSVYKELRGKYPRHLREDFCGTHRLSCEWVKRNKRNTAVCLDLDIDPLTYGKRVHFSELAANQKKRITPLRQNVLSVTVPKADLQIACNFSFLVFKERKTLIEYFRYAIRSLKNDGILLLELCGGPGMIEPLQERKSVQIKGKRKKTSLKFTYIWDQQSYDPITAEAKYAIHFRFPDGRQVRNAFNYDWRLWTIRELREAMLEAGFHDTCVYWETEHAGKGTGEFTRGENGDNAYSWIAYVAGLKSI